MEVLILIAIALVFYPTAFVVGKIKDRIYVSDVYHHCWRLICQYYKEMGKEDRISYEGEKLYENVEPWIICHNMHYYRTKVIMTYSTIANPLVSGQGVKYEFGMTPIRLAVKILNELTSSEDFFRLSKTVYKEDRKLLNRIYYALWNPVKY